MTTPTILPVILSGGAGTRLWPVSRKAAPKQFHALTSEQTMFAETLARCAGFAGQAWVLCGESHVGPARASAPGADLRFLVEPAARNTGPAAIAAAFAAADDALLLFLPSDHHVADRAAFERAVQAGAQLALQGKLVTFGITPTRAETGFGYIRRGAALETGFTVDAFVEKPDRQTAQAYLDTGLYSWNAGIFLIQASVLRAEARRHAPEIAAAAEAAVARAAPEGALLRLDADAWAQAPAQPLDIAVMEKTDRAAVVPVDMGWSDVGSWAALWDIAPKDARGNAVSGAAALIEAEGCYVRADGPAVALVGVKDLIVVATPDGVFIAPHARAQEVKDALEQLAQTRPDLR
jgi:mannose-1-phosphate guanylyltransferase/mannose-6-phosphate isomerase